jgi:hypothetical protein
VAACYAINRLCSGADGTIPAHSEAVDWHRP